MKSADGLDLHGVVTGAGPVTLVLLHGWTLDSTCWEPVAARLDGVRVLRYDHRGHGRSAAVDPATMTIEQLADDLAAVLAAEVPEGPIVLAGHSMGGMTAMALAERHPAVAGRVVGLALVATAAGGLGATFPAWLRTVNERPFFASARWSGRGALTRRPRLLAPFMRTMLVGRRPSRAALRMTCTVIGACRPTTVSGFLTTLGAHERRSALAAYADVPVEIMVGTRDRLTPPRYSRTIREALPHARLTLFPDAGHMLPLERTDGVESRLRALIGAAVSA
jgi:pimeloyl-ACP methyl ester carboxylesterase